MFKDLILYRIAPQWFADLVAAEQGLAGEPFTECGPTQEMSVGWVPPRGEAHGAMLESVGGQWIAKFFIEQKMLPDAVVKRKLCEKVRQLEEERGRKPGKKEQKELKDEVRLNLLPQAFTQQSSVWVWIDPQNHLLAIDTSSQTKADEVVTALIDCLPGLAVSLLDSRTAPTSAMSYWLRTQEAPHGFTVDRETELKSEDESKAVVRYANHPLDIDEVREHIEQGKLPTKLALTFDDRVSFVMTDSLQLRKIDILDVKTEDVLETGFDADVALVTGELRRMIPMLIAALGGEGRQNIGGAA